MVKEYREKFNSQFSEEKYTILLNDIQNTINRKLDFRICETPLFLNKNLTDIFIKTA